MKETRIVFFGTPEFALYALDSLQKSFTVAAVVTQPDRPSGRGKKILPSPVKLRAQALGIPLFQPVKIRTAEFAAWLQSISPDFLVTAAYGKILSPQILAVPRISALNVHASLLPRWRGAAPIHRAVLAGDCESGITIIEMDEGMDTGDIILQDSVPIGLNETSGDLHDKLTDLGAKLIVEAVTAILAGTAKKVAQDDNLATLAPPLTKEEEMLDWSASTGVIHNQIRGMSPWPGMYTRFKGERLKIWAGRPLHLSGANCGQVLAAGKEGILVGTGDGAYCISLLQPPGKKIMDAAAFLRGNLLLPGAILGK
ncbi:MAG: methionyl-tRNA formyltransferase [Dethiobacter sp.]|jgi:methionyl-tRNA formyltransferase|nr:methionyl-tRNA formyltransferase [Dethiobacter sp.]MBS3900613.1 methionyl-tRNA formyltransferase [Dethiobacter sp.]MBS3990220.1 methionyl-tRNA formyltransferase [Dethiobacter sp.]